MQFENFLRLDASAGSGKTFSLTVRILTLLFLKQNPHEIYAITFTKKAAKEMRDRLLEIGRYPKNHRQILRLVKTQVGEEVFNQNSSWVWVQILKNRVVFLTIDAFFSSILKRFYGYTKVSKNFTLTQEEDEIFLEKIYELITKDQLQIFLSQGFSLNSLQDAIKKSLGKLNDYKQILKNHAASTAQELEEQKQRCVKLAKVYVETALKLKDTNYFDEEKNKKVKIFHHSTIRVAQNSQQRLFSFETIFSLETLFKRAFLNDTLNVQFQTLKQQMQRYFYFYDLFLLHRFIESHQIMEQVINETAIDKGILTFEYVAFFVNKLLRHPKINRDFLYFRLDAQIKHLLIDEFQDTSAQQYEIFRPLIEEIVSGESVNNFRTFFYVGDKKQAIYGFRGGDSSLFDLVCQNHHLKTVTLPFNYRSCANIVHFINNCFSQVPNYMPSPLPQPKILAGFVEVRDIIAESEKNNVEVAGKEILNIIQALKNKGVLEDHIAIIARDNATAFEIIDFLKQNNIKTVFEGSTKITQDFGVKSLIEFLKYLYFQDDKDANFGKYCYEGFKFLTQRSDTKPLLKTFELEVIQAAFKVLQHFNIPLNKNILRFLNELQECGDWFDFIYNYKSQSDFQGEKIGVRILTQHKSKGLEFEHLIVLDRLKKGRPNSQKIIEKTQNSHLMDVTFRVENRTFFDTRYEEILNLNQAQKELEDLNLCYVALTRAKQSLFVLKCHNKDSKGKITYKGMFENKALRFKLQPTKIGILCHQTTAETRKNLQFVITSIQKYGAQKTVKKEQTNSAEINFGQALHYCLEVIGTFNMAASKEALEMTRGQFFLKLGIEGMKKLEKSVKNLLEDIQFQTLLQEAEIKKEEQILLQKNDQEELSILDLLLVKKDEAIIVDYKTGEFYNEYKVQMQRYRDAIARVYARKTIKSCLCFIDEKEVYFKWL